MSPQWTFPPCILEHSSVFSNPEFTLVGFFFEGGGLFCFLFVGWLFLFVCFKTRFSCVAMAVLKLVL